MVLPAGYTLRAPESSDLDAVAAVLIANEVGAGGPVVLGEDFIRGEWSRMADLATDAWVAADAAGTVVGYAQVVRDEPDIVQSWGDIHPEHQGRGIGTALLDRIEGRAAAMVAEPSTLRLRHSISAGNEAAAAMLRARGLQPVHHFWHMQIDLAGPVEAGPSPNGIEIGGIDARVDLGAVHGILEQAFVDDLSHHPVPFDRWVEEEIGSPSYDPTLWLLARDGDVPVGVLTASVGEDRGWVDYLGVLASHRGRGVGGALLRHAFALISDRGIRRVLVSVDARNPTGASAVYERAGMQAVGGWELWEREPMRTRGRSPR